MIDPIKSPLSYNLDDDKARKKLIKNFSSYKGDIGKEVKDYKKGTTWGEGLTAEEIENLRRSKGKFNLDSLPDGYMNNNGQAIKKPKPTWNEETGTYTPPDADGIEADWGAGGLTALGEAPSIIANASDKATSQAEANSKVLSTAVSGAKIGGSIVPGWGHAIGAVVGAVGGVAMNHGWRGELVKERDKESYKNMAQYKKQMTMNYYADKAQGIEQSQLDRLSEHYSNTDLETLKAQRNIRLGASGYSQS